MSSNNMYLKINGIFFHRSSFEDCYILAHKANISGVRPHNPTTVGLEWVVLPRINRSQAHFPSDYNIP